MELKEYCGKDAKSHAKMMMYEEHHSFEYTVESIRGLFGMSYQKAFDIVMQATLTKSLNTELLKNGN